MRKLSLLLVLGMSAGCPEWEYTPCFLGGLCEEEPGGGTGGEDIVYVVLEQNQDYSDAVNQCGASALQLPASFDNNQFAPLVDQMAADNFLEIGNAVLRTETSIDQAVPLHWQDYDIVDPGHTLYWEFGFDHKNIDFNFGPGGVGLIGFSGHGQHNWLSYGVDPSTSDCNVDIMNNVRLGDEDYLFGESYDGRARYAMWVSSCMFYTGDPDVDEFPLYDDEQVFMAPYSSQGLTIQHGFYDSPAIAEDRVLDFYDRLRNNSASTNLHAWLNAMKEPAYANNNPSVFFQARKPVYDALGGEPCVKATEDFREWNMLRQGQKDYKKMSEVHLVTADVACQDLMGNLGYDDADLYDIEAASDWNYPDPCQYSVP